MSKSVNVDFVTRQIEVDTDGKEYYVSAAVAAKDAEQSMLSAQNAANTAEKIATDLGLVDEAVQTAVSSAGQASNSATTASNKADIATAKADIATTKASEASVSADTATQKADAASTSATNAAQSYANADAIATQLTEYLATKETLTAPAVDKTLLIEGAAADAKVVGELKDNLDNAITNIETAILNTNSSEIISSGITDTVIDHYIINNNNGAIASFSNGILSGYIPVTECQNYNIKMQTLYIGDVAFYDKNKKPLFAFNINNEQNDNKAYGLTAAVWHGGSRDYVTFSGTGQNLTCFIKIYSGIAYMVFYIAKSNVTAGYLNYYGEHTNLDNIPISEITITNETNLQKKISDNTNRIVALEESIDAISPNGDILLNKSGTNIDVRSRFDSSNDIAVKFHVNSSNKVFNFNQYYTLPSSSDDNVTSGELFKTAVDDITGVYINETILGGNHGNDRGYNITFSSPHEFTESNIGETWKIDGHDFVIIKIVNDTTILGGFPVGSDNGLTMYAISTLSMSKDGITKPFESATREQIKPAINHQKIAVIDDKGHEITTDGIYKGKYFDIINTYDVIATGAMISHLRENVGNNTNTSYYDESINESVYTMNLLFHCRERGSITVFESIGFNRNGNFSFAHGVQSMSSNFNYWCVPATDYNSISLIPDERVELIKDTWTDETKPPIRYYQYTNNDATGNGMVIGFNNKYADGIDSLRKETYSAGFIFSTHKMYPLFYDYKNGQAVTNEDSYNMVCFRCPLTTYDNDIPSVAWYYVGDDIYLLIDAHASANKYLALPDSFNGRIVEAVEEYGDIKIGSVVAGSKIKVIVKNGYGSGLYRLSKQ